MKTMLFTSTLILVSMLSSCSKNDEIPQNEEVVIQKNEVPEITINEVKEDTESNTLDESKDTLKKIKEQSEDNASEGYFFKFTQLPEGYMEYAFIDTGAYCNFIVDDKLVYATDHNAGVFGMNGSMFSADYSWFKPPFEQPEYSDSFSIRIVIGGSSVGDYHAKFESIGEGVRTGIEEGSTPYKVTIYENSLIMVDGVLELSDKLEVVGKEKGDMVCGA